MSVPSRLPEPVVNLLPHLSIEKPIWLVGGGVRDLLMNQSTADYDFVIDGEVVNFARQLADRMGGNYYDLDKVRGIGRVILEETGGIRRTLDFARMRGPDIEADLKARDFTINALAVNLENPERLLDPTGGVKDLNAKVLRAGKRSCTRIARCPTIRSTRAANRTWNPAPGEASRIIPGACLAGTGS
jgi:tRNA nucleotidyltransferase/poly(A) polymerase